MKKVLLNPTVWLSALMLTVVALVFTACNGDDEDPKVVPTVTTTATPTDVTPSSAVVSGEITSNGGEIVLAAGICYSATSATPTVANDTTKTTVLTGKFAIRLKNLASGTTYHARAYATNSIGTSYGEVITFITGNEAPTADPVTIEGKIEANMEVTVLYVYNDKEGDNESGTTIQWYRADNAAGLNTVSIDGATAKTYKITNDDQGKIIWVVVIPKAAAGTQLGVETSSEKKGPVGEATTVTFMYDNKEVTYGILNSTKTGRQWLDRNLGAINAPSAYNDYANFGDLFQWGRLADGHQLIIRTPDVGDPTSGTSAPKSSDISTTLATSPIPVDGKFIKPSAAPRDWISPQNNDLWQGSDGINNPCPTGWHIPTSDEWNAEGLTNDLAKNYEQIKLTFSGYRADSGGDISYANNSCYYWSSTVSGVKAMIFYVQTNSPSIYPEGRAKGMACRCIKDDNQ